MSRFGLLAAGLAALRGAVARAAETRNGTVAPLTTERDKIAHLLRRAGFGYSRDDLDFFAGKGLDATVDYLLNYDGIPDDVDERIAPLGLDLRRLDHMQRWWLLRMIYTKRPLQEKMTLFWHGLLTSQAGKVPLPRLPNAVNPNPPPEPNLLLDQNQFFRAHALDDFGTIMRGISRDPAMVIYLDTGANRKGQPNENYARELMELFTLGRTGADGSPNYAEDDVREAARAFTGWGLNAARQFTFNPNQHDNGPKTIFGQTGNFDGDDVIDLILAHPSNAFYISRRLFGFFAYDDPEPEVLAPVMRAYQSSGGSVRATVRAVFTSPAFYSHKAYRARVKSPAEFLAGVARALKLQTDALNLDASCRRMSQALFNPPNVAGWPGGSAWINSTSWLERVNQVSRLVSIRRDDHTQPVDLAGLLRQSGLSTPEAVADYFLDLLLDGQVTPDQRLSMLIYLRDGVSWPQPTQPLDAADPAVDRKVRGLMYLIMAMPEYQLA